MKNKSIKSLITQKASCCGCRLCEHICPTNAIQLTKDSEGFFYPIVDENSCINCGLCSKYCTITDCRDEPSIRKIYIGFHNDSNIRKESRSGGVFRAIAHYIIEQGGTVYGVALHDDYLAYHNRAENHEQIIRFCGSKYIQSDVNSTFKWVAADLKMKLPVLFSGTPCQISSLKKYLAYKRIDYSKNLLTIDIVCHGVTSPKVWLDNINHLSALHKGKVEKCNFRDKRYGWDSHIESYHINNNLVNSISFTSIFYSHYALRPSCYNCRFTSLNRPADITIADAWGIKRQKPAWDHFNGVSLIIAHNARAHEAIKTLHNFTLEEVSIDGFMQPNLEHPTKKPVLRSFFWLLYSIFGYSFVASVCELQRFVLLTKNKVMANMVSIRNSILRK